MEGETQEILRRLVNYWAECLREEDMQEVGISPRARTRRTWHRLLRTRSSSKANND